MSSILKPGSFIIIIFLFWLNIVSLNVIFFKSAFRCTLVFLYIHHREDLSFSYPLFQNESKYFFFHYLKWKSNFYKGQYIFQRDFQNHTK